jgi:hypothetical protein
MIIRAWTGFTAGRLGSGRTQGRWEPPSANDGGHETNETSSIASDAETTVLYERMMLMREKDDTEYKEVLMIVHGIQLLLRVQKKHSLGERGSSDRQKRRSAQR